MPSISEDETMIALRRACDRHAGHTGEFTDGFPDGLVREIADCMPTAVFQVIVSPADDGTGRQLLSVRIDPDFHRYVTFATDYWRKLGIRRAHYSGRRF